MSILSNIFHKILGTRGASAAPPTSQSTPQATQQSTPQQQQAQQPQSASPQAQGTAPQQAQFQGGTQSAPSQQVDVSQVLTAKESKAGQKLNWRESIVDLMKLLDIDSSLAARKELAQELGYTGELNGSAEMNLWLHREVMKRLSQNGGKVPPELLVH